MEAATMPFYYKGLLEDAVAGSRKDDCYSITLMQTLEILTELRLPTKHFDCHAPIIYNKKLFALALKFLNWKVHNGYVIKSMYANQCRIEGEYLPDCKINNPLTLSEIQELIQDRSFFSYGDRGLQGDLKNYLQSTFPNKTIYEK